MRGSGDRGGEEENGGVQRREATGGEQKKERGLEKLRECVKSSFFKVVSKGLAQKIVVLFLNNNRGQNVA